MRKLARLYLDTARLGLMSPSAQLAARDFARLAGEGVSTLYFQNLLRGGSPLADGMPRLLPGIAGWPGISGLRQHFRDFLGLPRSAPVLFAGRATSLMRLAVRQLWARCRRLLVPDTVWPPYLRILEEERLRQGGVLVSIPIRGEVLSGQLHSGGLISCLARAYGHHGCDGFFLAAVSHDGVRVPVASLLTAIRQQAELRLAVIDGAQELAHVPVNLAAAHCDIWLAGCHKWLGAHQPLGVAVLGNPASATGLHEALVADCRTSLGDDPLLRFLLHLDDQGVDDVPETVNLAPLFTAWGALLDSDSSPAAQMHRFAARQENATRIATIARDCGWSPRLAHPSLRTGILLLQSTREAIFRLSARELEVVMAEGGVTLTGYGGGLVRLSLPARSIRALKLDQVLGLANGTRANRVGQRQQCLTQVSRRG